MAPMEEQMHDKTLSTNDTNLDESIDSRQQEPHDINYKSLVENNEINGLPTGGFKSGDHHLRPRYNRPRNRNSANKKQKEGKQNLAV